MREEEEEGIRRRQMTCEREREKRRKDRDVISCTAVSRNVADLHGYCVKLFVVGCINEPRGSVQRLRVRFVVEELVLQQVLRRDYSSFATNCHSGCVLKYFIPPPPPSRHQ